MTNSHQSTSSRSSLKGRTGPLRPILTLLNGDQSWLFSFPRPHSSGHDGKKKYFHIVTDPWLHGNLSMISPWLIGIESIIPAAAADGAAVMAIIREIEEAAIADTNYAHSLADDHAAVDAIFVHHDLLDHYHPPSLLAFPASVPVFAVPEAAPQIHKLGFFDTVVTTNDFDPVNSASREAGWQACHPGAPLPPWLSVFRLQGHTSLNFATAIVWSHDGQDELLLNSPHGIRVDQPSLRALLEKKEQGLSGVARPPPVPLAMLAALKNSFAFGMALTLGFAGSLALEELMRPRYWIRSGDAPLKYRGVVMLTTYDVPHELGDRKVEGKGTESERRPNLVDVGNGASFVLE